MPGQRRAAPHGVLGVGRPRQPARAGVRARPVAPGPRLRHPGARPGFRLPRDLPRRRRPWPFRSPGRPHGLRHPELRGRHGDAAGPTGRGAGRLGGHLDGRPDRAGAGQPAGVGRAAAGAQRRGADDPARGTAAHRRLSGPAGALAQSGRSGRRAVGHLAGLRSTHTRAVAAIDAAATGARRRRLQAPLRPGHCGAVPCHHARTRRGWRGDAVAELRPRGLPGAAAARRRFRPVVARHRVGHVASRPARPAARIRRNRAWPPST